MSVHVQQVTVEPILHASRGFALRAAKLPFILTRDLSLAQQPRLQLSTTPIAHSDSVAGAHRGGDAVATVAAVSHCPGQ